MGLAGPKKRIKLSHDPNNTTWTNNTESFGHKMMTAQGWQPGQYLGAMNAAHAEFHTAANASHIRVAIKDDNLGLGAKIGSGVGHGECTGLDVFKNILGRLNGKDEDELEREQKSREDLKRAIYTERKWGAIRFVPGGFLIGDKIQKLIDEEQERLRKLEGGSSSDSSDSDSSSESEKEEAKAPVLVEKVKKSKKRKAEDLIEKVPEVVAVKIRKSKKDKKKQSSEPRSEEEVTAALKDVKLSRKSKKDRKSKEEAENVTRSEPSDSESKRRKREKKEKKRLKAEKQELREKKAKSLEANVSSSSSSKAVTKESTPVTAPSSGRSTPMMQGRHAVRARNIAQKRMASMDVASLNQIFMIKS